MPIFFATLPMVGRAANPERKNLANPLVQQQRQVTRHQGSTSATFSSFRCPTMLSLCSGRFPGLYDTRLSTRFVHRRRSVCVPSVSGLHYRPAKSRLICRQQGTSSRSRSGTPDCSLRVEGPAILLAARRRCRPRRAARQPALSRPARMVVNSSAGRPKHVWSCSRHYMYMVYMLGVCV